MNERTTRIVLTVATVVVLLAVLAFIAVSRDVPPIEDAPPPVYPQTSAEPRAALRYDTEYPAIGYATTARTDAVAELEARLASGAAVLEHDASRGYLASVLGALDIGVESQVLVFSKTSVQAQIITATTPRAIYFNDDTYVGWVPGSRTLEVASLDPRLGPVFYTLAQDSAAPVGFERHLGECLRCHDSYSLTGGGVPRFITGSGYTDVDGNLVAHEGWILTSDRTPLKSRWGGWYVSGYHGEQVHLGNIAVEDVAELRELETLRTGNLENLDSLLDTSAYLSNKSDIVALLVLEHQVRVQNAITRVRYDTVGVPSTVGAASGRDSSPVGASSARDLPARIAELAEPLVEALFLAGEIDLTDRISGTSGFAAAFEARGPRDSNGRSLRELDLTTRLFKYPLSYAIYSHAFDALPAEAKDYVYARIREILAGDDESEASARLSAADRAAILEILRDTKPDFAATVL
ncbi:MAG TPA: hypothetical protein VIM81_07040 [Gammaproteobacteria bacterium]